jgi:hypothetical protein
VEKPCPIWREILIYDLNNFIYSGPFSVNEIRDIVAGFDIIHRSKIKRTWRNNYG